MKKKKLMTYKEFYQKHFGEWTALDIRYGWIDYCRKNKIRLGKVEKGGSEEVTYVNDKKDQG